MALVENDIIAEKDISLQMHYIPPPKPAYFSQKSEWKEHFVLKKWHTAFRPLVDVDGDYLLSSSGY